MSYSEIATALNAIFQTTYTRSAAIGRAKRMGLADARPEERPNPSPKARLPSPHRPRENHGAELRRPVPPIEAFEPATLRRADVDPRHLSLADLQTSDCRYPYGGDAEGEPISFCGHPRHENSSYCAAHLELTRSTEPAPEAAAGETARQSWRPHDRSMGAVAIPMRWPRRHCRDDATSLLDFKFHRE